MRLTAKTLLWAGLLFTPASAHAAADVQDRAVPVAAADGQQASPMGPQELAAPVPDAPAPATTRRGFRTLFCDLGGDFKALPSRGSFAVAAAGGTTAFALHPFDDDVNGTLRDTSVFKAGDRLGNTFTMMGATFAVYGVGLATGHDRVTHVALDVVRAQVVSQVLVQGLKHTVRRDRPDGSNRLSFPSGHAAITFATATVLQRHHGLAWALPAYGLATYVSTSRLHDDVHYLSDVVVGATIGILAGRTVTRHGASTFVFAPVFVPGGAGILVTRSSRS